MTPVFTLPRVVSALFLLLVAPAACGGGGSGSTSAVSCDDFNAKFSSCDQATKDSVASFCPKTTDDCRRCLVGLPDVCKNTEACDPQCKAK